MDYAARRSRGGLLEGLYKAVDYGVHKLWEYNNVGKRYEDIPVLGQRQSEE